MSKRQFIFKGTWFNTLIIISLLNVMCNDSDSRTDAISKDSSSNKTSSFVAHADPEQMRKKFMGVWLSNKNKVEDGTSTQGYLEINKKTAIFMVLGNQLNLVFSTKQKGDTLMMFYDNNNSEWGRLMEEIKTPSLKHESLFAKCVMTNNNEINISYINKRFTDAVNSEMMKDKMSWPSPVPPFPKTFYFSNSNTIFADLDKKIESESNPSFILEYLQKYSSHKQLESKYGSKNIIKKSGSISNYSLADGLGNAYWSVLYPNSANEVEVYWENKSYTGFKGVSHIGKKSNKSNWKTANGIKLGTSLESLTKLNGKPVSFYCCETDGDGTVDFNNGALDREYSSVVLAVYVGSKTESAYNKIYNFLTKSGSGAKAFSSNDPNVVSGQWDVWRIELFKREDY